MTAPECHAVTGAFGYSGRYIVRHLLESGGQVRTLTNSPPRPLLFEREIEVHPLAFDDREGLERSLAGVSVLYNTYWVRFNHRRFTHADAVRNTIALFDAAKSAGVRRIVHVSITNPSRDSELQYFRGKAELEERLRQLGVSHAILRPAVLFGKEDILINNIAWMLRRFPLFGVFGDGLYRLQPIYVDDFARLAVTKGASRDDVVVNAIGPETFTYRALVEQIGTAVGVRRPIVSIPPLAGYVAARAVGLTVGDVVLTRDEIRGLMQDLLYVDAPPAGTTRLTDWASEYGQSLGTAYASELARRQTQSGVRNDG